MSLSLTGEWPFELQDKEISVTRGPNYCLLQCDYVGSNYSCPYSTGYERA